MEAEAAVGVCDVRKSFNGSKNENERKEILKGIYIYIFLMPILMKFFLLYWVVQTAGKTNTYKI